MPRKQVPIRTRSCVSITPDGSQVMWLDEMTDEQRDYIGTKLSVRLLNSQFAGRAEFSSRLPPAEDVFPQLAEIRLS